MNNNITIRIGYPEAFAMILVLIGTKAFLGYPRLMTELGMTAGWMIVIVGGIAAIGFWLVIAQLIDRFPGKSLIKINEELLGSFFGTALNLTFLVYIIVVSSVLLRQFADIIVFSALPEAPISSLTFLFLIPAVAAVYMGLEAISRSTYISLPFILVGVIAVLLSLYNQWDAKQLLPVLGTGLGAVLKYGFLTVTTYEEILVLAILAPYISIEKSKLRMLGIESLLVVITVFTLIVLVYLMIFPIPGGNENLAPFYQLSRAISFGRYFQRVEAVFILFWTFTAFLRISISILVAVLVFMEIFKLPYYRPILPAIGVFIFSLSMTASDLMQTVVFEVRYHYLYGWLITLFLPCLIFGFAVLKGEGARDDNAKEGS